MKKFTLLKLYFINLKTNVFMQFQEAFYEKKIINQLTQNTKKPL